MLQIHPKKLTFEEYLAYEDSTDNRYELIDGALIPLPPESRLNILIANYLFLALIKVGVRFELVYPHTCEIQVPVLHPKDAANRYPDLVVLKEEHISLTAKRFTITSDMPPPQLVVEVVSPGKANRDNDYIRKRAQYAARAIPEYWIVDRHEQSVTVLYLEAGKSLETRFEENTSIKSPTFPQLDLTPQQIFAVAL